MSLLTLAQDLLNDGLTYVGSIRSNKAEISDAMNASNQRDAQSSIFGFKDQLTLVSYVPSQKKAVLSLSTMHHDNRVDGGAHKPEIILQYNQTKSGVDNLDHLATMFTARRKVNCWPVVLFRYMLDVGAVAAFIVWMANFPQWKAAEGKRRRRVFLADLAKALVTPQIERQVNIPTLHTHVRLCMHLCGAGNDQPALPAQQAQVPVREGKRKRCSLCPQKVDKKVRHECATCKKPVCPTHSKQQVVVCDRCA